MKKVYVIMVDHYGEYVPNGICFEDEELAKHYVNRALKRAKRKLNVIDENYKAFYYETIYLIKNYNEYIQLILIGDEEDESN